MSGQTRGRTLLRRRENQHAGEKERKKKSERPAPLLGSQSQSDHPQAGPITFVLDDSLPRPVILLFRFGFCPPAATSYYHR